MYDSMGDKGHKDANAKLKRSVEDICNERTPQKWKLEQIQVPQQTDANSCGYRMLYNIDKLCNHQELETIEEEEMALEGYIIEIMKMLKEKQQQKYQKSGRAKTCKHGQRKGARNGNRRGRDNRGHNRDREQAGASRKRAKNG